MGGRSAGPDGAPLSEPEHVLHVEQPAVATGEEAAGAQCAMRIRDAARRLVRDLDPLADAREEHRVVADDVPAPDGGETDAGGVALAGDAVALEHPDLVEPATERLGDDLPHAQGGAGGRVDLVPMVRLDDLDVVAGRE